MSQDQLFGYDESDAHTFDDWGTEDVADIDLDDENPNLWESDVAGPSQVAAVSLFNASA